MALIALLAIAPSALAAERAYVSRLGDDAAGCSQLTPCRSFARAVDVVDARGTVSALTSGEYGPVAVTKAVTLDGAGHQASIDVAAGTAVRVDAPLADVTLRGLTFAQLPGCAAGSPVADGVAVAAAQQLTLENVAVFGFSRAAVSVDTNAVASVIVRDSQLRRSCSANVRARGPALNLTLEGNVLTAAPSGVVVEEAVEVRLDDNTFFDPRWFGAGDPGSAVLIRSGKRTSLGNNRLENASLITGSSPAYPTVTPAPTPQAACRVPRLKRATLRQARRRASRAHCRIGRVTRGPRRRARSGRVYRQVPAPGARRAAGTRIHIRLTRGKVARRSRRQAGAPLHLWVNATGDDANDCTLQLPCRTLQRALDAVAEGGMVSVVDSGSYGSALITRPVYVDGSGSETVVSSVTVATAAESGVVLRGLTVRSSEPCVAAGTQSGIDFQSGGWLHVERSTASGFADAGIRLAATGPATLSQFTTRQNCRVGLVGATGAGFYEVVLDEATIADNPTGVAFGGPSLTAPAELLLARSIVRGNQTAFATQGASIFYWDPFMLTGNASLGSPPRRYVTF